MEPKFMKKTDPTGANSGDHTQLRVARDDDDGVIEVDEDQVMRPLAPRAVRAVVSVLTALLSD
ncbi:hypothetical protein A4G26_28030 [Mycobacterium kansasii]|nr:hypothetical protein A4G26_28030 [Mycobacterium kansasii]